jgi:hypothetical protein
MRSEKKELREALKLAIKTLILQEVRVLQHGQVHSPAFIIDEMARSIQEAKRQIMVLVRLLPPKERSVLIKRLIRQSVDEEIDQAIQIRKTRCFRCIHVRYFDEAGSTHVNLPFGKERAHVIGCEMIRPASGIQCKNFIESSMAVLTEDYLNEMAFLYEVKEMFDQFEEVWDYLTR